MNSTRPNQAITVIALLSFHLATLASPVRSEDWPHWRGPNRNDIVAEESRWESGGWPPKMAWNRTVGVGSSSPLVIGDRLYTMGWEQGNDYVYCLDAKSGKPVWEMSYPCPQYGRHSTGDEGLYSGPTSTPEYDAETGYLYTLSTDGDLHCWDTRNAGQKIWSLNLYERYNVSQRPKSQRSGLRDYGYTTSPLLVGDWLIVEVGDDEGNLMAFARRTGERVWTSEYRGPAGHTGGPVPMTVEGIPCVAVLAYDGLHVARLDGANAGKTVARYDWATEFANNIASPAVHENHVIITSGYNHDAICKLKITAGGAEKVWEQPFASLVCSPIIHNGNVYWAWQKLRCLDFATGQPKWDGGNFSDAGSCILTADSRLIVWGDSGQLVLVDTADRSPDRYHELSRIDGLSSTDVWPHVVLANGMLYCKDRQGNIKALSLQAAAKR